MHDTIEDRVFRLVARNCEAPAKIIKANYEALYGEEVKLSTVKRYKSEFNALSRDIEIVAANSVPMPKEWIWKDTVKHNGVGIIYTLITIAFISLAFYATR